MTARRYSGCQFDRPMDHDREIENKSTETIPLSLYAPQLAHWEPHHSTG